VPYFYLKLYDLKGGDSLTLVAKHSDGKLIYAPPSAQIPMPIQLIEPSPDQTILPGEEVVVRWVGGEGATHIEASYVSDQEGDIYQDVRRYGEVEQITVPSGVIKEGGGIIAAAAMSGEHPSFYSGSSEDVFISSFVVTRYQGGHWAVAPETTLAGRLASDSSLNDDRCPNHGSRLCITAGMACILSTPLFHHLWEERYKIDREKHSPCDLGKTGFLMYCTAWNACFDMGYFPWVEGCLCPNPEQKTRGCCNDV